MITVDVRQLEQLEKDLIFLGGRAIPFATKATINRAAFETQKTARANIKRDMTNRNPFTVRSVQVDQARTLDIRNQEAIVGSIADYMEPQEFGGSKTDPTIATGYSAGQQGARPRTRLPRKPNKLRNIKLGPKVGGARRSQRNVAAVMQAAASGDKYVYLKGRKSEGLFRVLGGKRKPRIKMVHDLSRKSVIIPRNPWLLPATNAITPQLDSFYAAALRFQLKRIGR